MGQFYHVRERLKEEEEETEHQNIYIYTCIQKSRARDELQGRKEIRENGKRTRGRGCGDDGVSLLAHP